MTSEKLLRDKWGNHFENVFKEDRSRIASIIFLYISLVETNQLSEFPTLYSIAEAVDLRVLNLSDTVQQVLCDIQDFEFDKPRLLDIASNLLAGCR
jgi:hypothetical protein